MIQREFRVMLENGDHDYVTLTYYGHMDPWSIHMSFGNDNNWVFSRELLLDGLKDFAGLGDVKIWPAQRFTGMRLESPDGECELRFVRRLLQQFADETCVLVSPGLEHMNMDDVIIEIFKKEGAE